MTLRALAMGGALGGSGGARGQKRWSCVAGTPVTVVRNRRQEFLGSRVSERRRERGLLRGRSVRGMTRLRTKASLFGVGTPEVLVIGVVALLVFGPKGLADAAKSLGKTLRTFQPTIQELKEVSEEFKTTLEDEIGLDEFKTSMRGTGGSASRPYRASDEEKESNLEEMRRESAAAAWGGDAGEGTAGRSEEPAAPTPTFEESLSAPDAEGDGTSSDLSNLSVEELQAELERRKNEQ